MGYYIYGFGVKPKDIEDVFNSKSTSVFEKVTSNQVFENFADFEIQGYDSTPLSALEDIIWGNEYDTYSNWAYGYALIGIVATFGKELPYDQEIKLGFETDYINQVLREHIDLVDLEIENILLKAPCGFNIPKLTEFPMISSLDLASLEILNTILKDVEISKEQIQELQDSIDDETGYAYEHIMGIKENIEFCLEHSLTMVLVCH